MSEDNSPADTMMRIADTPLSELRNDLEVILKEQGRMLAWDVVNNVVDGGMLLELSLIDEKPRQAIASAIEKAREQPGDYIPFDDNETITTLLTFAKMSDAQIKTAVLFHLLQACDELDDE